MTRTDVHALARAFARYNKRREQYERYFKEQQQGLRATIVALAGEAEAEAVGYSNLLWQSGYEPFRREAIPEITDLNVVAEFRRRGIGTALIGECERIAAAHGKKIIGIGVGLTPDYEAARRLYPSLGYVYDGRGVHANPPWDDAMYLTKSLTLQ